MRYLAIVAVVAVAGCAPTTTDWAGVHLTTHGSILKSAEPCTNERGNFDFDDTYCRTRVFDQFVDATGNPVAAPEDYPYAYLDTVWTDRQQRDNEPMPVVHVAVGKWAHLAHGRYKVECRMPGRVQSVTACYIPPVGAAKAGVIILPAVCEEPDYELTVRKTIAQRIDKLGGAKIHEGYRMSCRTLLGVEAGKV